MKTIDTRSLDLLLRLQKYTTSQVTYSFDIKIKELPGEIIILENALTRAWATEKCSICKSKIETNDPTVADLTSVHYNHLKCFPHQFIIERDNREHFVNPVNPGKPMKELWGLSVEP